MQPNTDVTTLYTKPYLTWFEPQVSQIMLKFFLQQTSTIEKRANAYKIIVRDFTQRRAEAARKRYRDRETLTFDEYVAATCN